jgi:hypothetical protein
MRDRGSCLGTQTGSGEYVQNVLHVLYGWFIEAFTIPHLLHILHGHLEAVVGMEDSREVVKQVFRGVGELLNYLLRERVACRDIALVFNVIN